MFRICVGTLVLGVSLGRASAEPISLDEALRRATARPTVEVATAERDAARGNLTDAALPRYNPSLDASAGPRWSSGQLLTGISVGVGQTFELGGKRQARKDAAAARLRAADVGIGASKLIARAEAWRAYELAIIARLRVDATKEAEAAASEVVSATQQSQALGEETQLRLNLTAADFGKAKHDRIDAERDYAEALSDLADAIGAGPNELVEPSVNIPVLPKAPDEATLVARAIASKPELAQAKAEAEAARADVQNADAARVPDVTLSATYGYEPDVDVKTQSLLFGASIALPFRNRNQGERAATRARARGADIEARWLRTQVEREARLTAQSYARALAALQAFDVDVTEKLHENLQLANDSFRAGKIDFYAFSQARRELLANRLGYLDAAAEAIDAWAVLATATATEVKP
jgi:cobalt-zinc-cadmium efflux system outer membrane protein